MFMLFPFSQTLKTKHDVSAIQRSSKSVGGAARKAVHACLDRTKQKMRKDAKVERKVEVSLSFPRVKKEMW